jgi:predicted DNA-binding transcriptional regulator AlpA
VTQAQDEILLRDVDVAKRYGVSRRSVWLWADQGRIPKPVPSVSGMRWRRSEVAAHIEQLCKKAVKELAS